jgi:predicted nucleotidyltransferase
MVKIYKLKLTLLQQDILRYLYINSSKVFNARALALALNVSQPAISKALPKLKKEDLITVTKGKRFSIALNRENPLVIRLKRVDNLKQLYEISFVKHLISVYNHPKAIILFGSFSKGEDIEKSDIDIAIITSKKISLDLEDYEKKLKRAINIHEVDLNKVSKEFKNSLYNGIVLEGSL